MKTKTAEMLMKAAGELRAAVKTLEELRIETGSEWIMHTSGVYLYNSDLEDAANYLEKAARAQMPDAAEERAG